MDNRLTAYYDGNHGICERVGCANHNTENCLLAADYQCESLHDIVDRLAAYQDTGLSPEEVQGAYEACVEHESNYQQYTALGTPEEITAALSRLAEYEVAEREERLVMLPCAIGEKICDDGEGYDWILDDVGVLVKCNEDSAWYTMQELETIVCVMMPHLAESAEAARAEAEKGEGE